MTAFTAVTECPYCKTAFLVGLDHLDQAQGKVRCGSCLGIFHAHKSMIVEQKNLFSMDGEVLNAAAVANPVDSNYIADSTNTSSDNEPTLSQDELEIYNDEFDQLMNSDAVTPPLNSHQVSSHKVADDRYFSEPEPEVAEDTIPPGDLVQERHDDMFENDPVVKRQRRIVNERAGITTSPISNRYFVVGIVITSLLLLLQLIWLFSDYPGTNKSRLYCMMENCVVTENIQNYFSVVGNVKPSVESDDILIAKIELHNKDVSQAHILPNIVITFEDADGVVQAGREFPPKSYLGPEQQRLKQLNANQRIAFEITFLHPSRNVKSFYFSVSPAN